jgi:pimeloyl-ACP methyl ester carboxylesterase
MVNVRLANKYVTVNGLRIRYLEAGAGRPTVLVHPVGVETYAESWLVNFDAFMKAGHLYALDLPGWGLSDGPKDGRYSFPLWVETIKGFCDALKLEQVDIAGRTLGGWLAALFAHQYPQRVRRVALLGTAGLNPGSFAAAEHSVWPTRESLRRVYTDDAIRDEVYQRLQEPGREAAYQKLWAYVGDPTVREEWSLRARLPQMQMPILFVSTDNNRGGIPVQYAWEGFMLAPLARLHVCSQVVGATGPEFERVAVSFLTAEEITSAK